MALMSLDIFGNGYTLWQTVGALIMHNIPTIILLVTVVISWRKGIVGAIGFSAFAIFYLAWVSCKMFTNGFEWYYLAWIIQIAGITLLIGYLFFLGWKKKIYEK